MYTTDTAMTILVFLILGYVLIIARLTFSMIHIMTFTV